MTRVFVIADLHFGHRKLHELRGVDDDELVRRWNEVVTKRDVVYVLGDVFRLDRVPDLRGTKKLALGNHDRYPIARYIEHFSKVAAMFEYDGAILTHIPVHPGQSCRYRANVHGHTHDRVLVFHTCLWQPVSIVPGDGYVRRKVGVTEDSWYRCVSAEQTGYRPVLLDDVLRGIGPVAAMPLGVCHVGTWPFTASGANGIIGSISDEGKCPVTS